MRTRKCREMERAWYRFHRNSVGSLLLSFTSGFVVSCKSACCFLQIRVAPSESSCHRQIRHHSQIHRHLSPTSTPSQHEIKELKNSVSESLVQEEHAQELSELIENELPGS